jgi:hypothetical protein
MLAEPEYDRQDAEHRTEHRDRPTGFPRTEKSARQVIHHPAQQKRSRKDRNNHYHLRPVADTLAARGRFTMAREGTSSLVNNRLYFHVPMWYNAKQQKTFRKESFCGFQTDI